MVKFAIDVQLAVDPAPAGIAELLTETAAATLNHEDVAPPASLTILLTDDEALRQLNREFLNHDAPTDVLSFPAGDLMPGMAEAGFERYLGDLAISVSRAAEQAAVSGHSLTAELQLLTVHGVLHLLGHDHAGDRERTTMWAAQAAVLQRLNAEITAPAVD